MTGIQTDPARFCCNLNEPVYSRPYRWRPGDPLFPHPVRGLRDNELHRAPGRSLVPFLKMRCLPIEIWALRSGIIVFARTAIRGDIAAVVFGQAFFVVQNPVLCDFRGGVIDRTRQGQRFNDFPQPGPLGQVGQYVLVPRFLGPIIAALKVPSCTGWVSSDYRVSYVRLVKAAR
jgi:hypothetical protein